MLHSDADFRVKSVIDGGTVACHEPSTSKTLYPLLLPPLDGTLPSEIGTQNMVI